MTFSKSALGILLATLLLNGSVSESAEAPKVSKTVLVRNERFKPVFRNEVLKELVSSTAFDGKHFKIVKGKNEEPISLDESDEALLLKAATTYYHLTLARDYWVNVMKSEYVRNLPKMTVRLEITNKFSELGHYQHDLLEPQYNNALSIPAGTPMEGVEIPSWNHEIWFRPMKKILSKDLPASGLDAEGNPLTKYLSMLANPIQGSAINRIIQVSFQQVFYPQTLKTPYRELILRQFGLIGGIGLILKGSQRASRLFVEKYYYLDTAMVPEIIYHEYSHVALSDHLDLSLSTPVLEGLADFFSTLISGKPYLGTKIRKYSLSQPKDGENKTLYNQIFESNQFSNSDFVLSVLTELKKEFPDIGTALIYDSRTRLKTDTSDIRHDLLGSILESCNQICKDPRYDRMKMREIWEARGF